MDFSRLALAAVVVLSSAAMPGCSLFGGGNHDSGVTLITAPNAPIADVPVPAGFSLVKNSSTSRVMTPANTRMVDHLYSGNEDYLPVIRFYRDQLPAKGWAIVDQTQNGPETTIHFTKGSEDCFVTVSAPTLTLNAHIRIKIDPIVRGGQK